MVPFGPCPTVPAGHGIHGAWLPEGEEIEPAIFARASKLRAVSMDMTGGYAKSVREHAPHAVICIDPYHVVQLANQALDEVRRAYWNQLRSLGDQNAAKRFRDARWSLLKKPEKLTDTQAATLARLKTAGGEVWRAYTLKEAVRGIFAAGLDIDDVTVLIDRLLSRLARCRLQPFVKLGKTIRKHRDGILAAIRLGINQGRTEALNNKVRLITRRAYGFHSAKAALALYLANRPAKPVAAVIYSHSHIDHFGGAGGVMSAADAASGKVKVIAPDGFMEHAVAENVIAGNAMRRRAQYMYGATLPTGERAQIDTGLGKALSQGTVSLIAPNDLIKQEYETRTIDGVEIEFHLVPGSEAPSEMILYFPQFKLLDMAEDATHNMHNLYTLRGAEIRDGRLWSRYLSKAIERYGERTDAV